LQFAKADSAATLPQQVLQGGLDPSKTNFEVPKKAPEEGPYGSILKLA
jgi:hypothetical protein